MTQEEKQLLLTDLCARLLYAPRVKYFYIQSGVLGYSDEGFLSFEKLSNFNDGRFDCYTKTVSNIVPYLRPMSSMTTEEYEQMCSDTNYADCYASVNAKTNWLLKRHFDVNDLIPKNLALVATEGMYEL